jgi:hypothetical protein
LHPKLVTLPAHNSKPPHTCVVSGRRDGEVVDFCKDFTGSDPHIYIRRERIEAAAEELCGMVRQPEVDALRADLEEARTEADRLGELVAGGEDLSAVEDRLREALGPTPDPDPKGSLND